MSSVQLEGGVWYIYSKDMQRPCLMPCDLDNPDDLGVLCFRTRAEVEKYIASVADLMDPRRLEARHVPLPKLKDWAGKMRRHGAWLLWEDEIGEGIVRHAGVLIEGLLRALEEMLNRGAESPTDAGSIKLTFTLQRLQKPSEN